MDRRIFLTTISLMFDSGLRPCATCSAEGKEEDHALKRKHSFVLIKIPGVAKAQGGKAVKSSEVLISSGPQFWRMTHDEKNDGALRRVGIIGVKFAPTSSKINRRGGVSTPEAFWLLVGRSRSSWEDKLVGWVSDILYHIPGTDEDDAFTRA